MTKEDNPGVIAPPPLIFLCFLILGYVLNRYYPLTVLEGPLSTIISAIFFVYAGLTAGLAFFYMVKSGTNVDVRKPTNTIVTKSVYSYTRNPMYLSMAILLIAFSLLLNALWIALLIPFFMFVMQKGVIEREEAYLENKFGSEYLQYKSQVRRWI
ncbi:MAG: protein-S-isoprenylcysteine methyltransferase [Thermodesulfobacteriota bacterium]|nr:MAG: protein-S-isoprenylcysteine methyltransferase [Thermodesulfobacteriota bacterium]